MRILLLVVLSGCVTNRGLLDELVQRDASSVETLPANVRAIIDDLCAVPRSETGSALSVTREYLGKCELAHSTALALAPSSSELAKPPSGVALGEALERAALAIGRQAIAGLQRDNNLVPVVMRIAAAFELTGRLQGVVRDFVQATRSEPVELVTYALDVAILVEASLATDGVGLSVYAQRFSTAGYAAEHSRAVILLRARPAQ